MSCGLFPFGPPNWWGYTVSAAAEPAAIHSHTASMDPMRPRQMPSIVLS